MPLLEIKDLRVYYDKALALDGVSLHVDAGDLVVVLGPNGAGKSTLLKAISGAVQSSGAMLFDGTTLNNLTVEQIVGLGICHCPEGRRLFSELSVNRNLMLGAYLRNDAAEIASDLEKIYAIFSILRDRKSQQASTLSGGEQQMLAIGRALMGRPKLLILDEPSAGIAHRLKKAIFQAIRQIQQNGTAILLVEQDARLALGIAKRAYVLEHGKIVREGQATDLAADGDIRNVYLGI